MTRFIATFFGVGRIPLMPGTFGSLAALPCGYGLHVLGGLPLLLAASVVVFGVGVWATALQTAGQADHDPSEIVIDEVVGQWIALAPLSAGLWWMDTDPYLFPWPGCVAAFVFFRFFDILKPWPISWADRKTTALGVMLDDVLAGIAAAVCVTVLAAVVHGWLL